MYSINIVYYNRFLCLLLDNIPILTKYTIICSIDTLEIIVESCLYRIL